VGAATLFTNAVDTKTVGADFVGQYTWKLAGGNQFVLDGSYSYNKTTIEKVKSQSSVIPIDVLFDQTQRTLIQEALPHHRATLGGTYTMGKWKFGLNNTYYGDVSGQGFTGVKKTWSGKWLTDVTVNYKVNKNFDVTLGGNNIFDIYPDNWGDAGTPLNQLGFTYGWETLPFGLNGASYYVRGKFTF
jgi:iron complex outermembrane receptor protein